MKYYLNKDKVVKYYLRYQPARYLLLKLNQEPKRTDGVPYYDLTWMDEYDGVEFYYYGKGEYRSINKGNLTIIDGKRSWFNIVEEDETDSGGY